ncbi:helix-turn-helix transcriptional regulator [Leptolyngbya sp. FACHB-321]|uniref:winged helix-turn-helix transcriptional regulator n=1 Tax=Leptolyngbya sp. FACHB-321 TaxID=2692807 RepID=UPI001681D2C8|nr:helix-turn-helix transcriptional regulator [Leptolyngbya sp. FACHB-321]
MIQQQSCAFDQTSGVRKALDLVADKWTALIIMALAQDTKRYGELHRKIDGISQKMLTQTLRQLEGSGLIHRKVHPVVPPMVEYSLTLLGETLVEPLKALCSWAAEHFHEVEAAREQASTEKTNPNEAA